MYRKRLLIFILIVLLMTGCSKITNNLDDIVDKVMIDKDIPVNTVSTGYELYIPNGIMQIKDNDYNQTFRIRGRNIYLYVDTISYYYKNALNFKSNDDYNYYYKEIKLGDKTGYIGIKKEADDLFFVEVIYNYSKMEFYSDSYDLPVILANSLIMQKSIKYNDTLIKTALGNDVNDGREIKYELDSPKNDNRDFDEFLQEYVPNDEEEIVLPEED